MSVSNGLVSFHSVLGIPSWINPKIEAEWPHVEYYFENEDAFPPSVWAYLFFFAQLAHHFGWDAMKKVFRTYEELIKEGKSPTNDQDKDDLFYITYSREVMH